jgi:hypothetical protein
MMIMKLMNYNISFICAVLQEIILGQGKTITVNGQLKDNYRKLDDSGSKTLILVRDIGFEAVCMNYSKGSRNVIFYKNMYIDLTVEKIKGTMLKLHTHTADFGLDCNGFMCCTCNSGVCDKALKNAHEFENVTVFCCLNILPQVCVKMMHCT